MIQAHQKFVVACWVHRDHLPEVALGPNRLEHRRQQRVANAKRRGGGRWAGRERSKYPYRRAEETVTMRRTLRVSYTWERNERKTEFDTAGGPPSRHTKRKQTPPPTSAMNKLWLLNGRFETTNRRRCPKANVSCSGRHGSLFPIIASGGLFPIVPSPFLMSPDAVLERW